MFLDPPDAGELHLWWASLDTADASFEEALPILGATERAEVLRIRPQLGRRRAAIRRGILRQLLARYLRVSPADLYLQRDSNGKPACPEAGRLAFSCSSSGSEAIYAFCGDGSLGVDLEYRADSTWEDFPASRFMSDREYSALCELPPPERIRRSARVWVVKEAVAKATGLGFTLPPSGIEVDGDGPTLDVRLGGPWAAYSSVPWAAQLVAEDDRRLAAVAADPNWVRPRARHWGGSGGGP